MATMAGDPTRVLVVDDHHTFAELLMGALQRESDLLCIGHAATGRDGVAMSLQLHAHAVLMDLQLPDMDGFTATERILAQDDTIRVMMLTAHASASLVARAVRAGACAYLNKTGHLVDVLSALRRARRGDLVIAPALIARWDESRERTPFRPTLTPREQDVLELMGARAKASARSRASCRWRRRPVGVTSRGCCQSSMPIRSWRRWSSPSVWG